MAYTRRDIDRFVKNGKVVMAYANWCGHCKPVVNRLRSTYPQAFARSSNGIYELPQNLILIEADNIDKSSVSAFPTIFYLTNNGTVGETHNTAPIMNVMFSR